MSFCRCPERRVVNAGWAVLSHIPGVKEGIARDNFHMGRRVLSTHLYLCDVIGLRSWAFSCGTDFAAPYSAVLVVNGCIYKVLVPAVKIHNHKIKLCLNLGKTQFEFESIILE